MKKRMISMVLAIFTILSILALASCQSSRYCEWQGCKEYAYGKYEKYCSFHKLMIEEQLHGTGDDDESEKEPPKESANTPESQDSEKVPEYTISEEEKLEFELKKHRAGLPLEGKWEYQSSYAKMDDDEGHHKGDEFTYWMMNNDEDGVAYYIFKEDAEFAKDRRVYGNAGTFTEYFNGETYTGTYSWNGEKYILKGNYEGFVMTTEIVTTQGFEFAEIGECVDHYFTQVD